MLKRSCVDEVVIEEMCRLIGFSLLLCQCHPFVLFEVFLDEAAVDQLVLDVPVAPFRVAELACIGCQLLVGLIFYFFELKVLAFFDDLYHSYLAGYRSVIDFIVTSSTKASYLVSDVNRSYFGQIHPQNLVIVLGVQLQDLYEPSLVS